MLPARLNLTLYKGDTWVRTISLTDDNDVPLNFTGYTPLCEFRIDDEDGAIQATPSINSSNAATGIFVLTIATAVTSLLVDGTWDFQLTSGGGVVQTYLYGNVTILPETSRP